MSKTKDWKKGVTLRKDVDVLNNEDIIGDSLNAANTCRVIQYTSNPKTPDNIVYLTDENLARQAIRQYFEAIEDFDAALPILLGKKPDVLAITGDHSTPCAAKGHSWHPQPVLLNSAYSGSDKLERFTETSANAGSLGVFDAKYLIRLMQANAKMFDKFGA